TAGGELGLDSESLGPDVTQLIFRETTLANALLEQLLVLALAAAVRVDDQVELEVLRVVAVAAATERLLQVHVPARVPALGAFPEDPDRARFAGPLQHEDAVPLPAVPRRPGMRLRAGWEREL